MNKNQPRSVITIKLDYGFEVSEFELQSRYWDHFKLIPWGEVLNSLIPYPCNRLNSITAVLLQGLLRN